MFAAIPSFFAATTCNNNFFGLPRWWEYLSTQPTPPDCTVTFNFPDDIWAVALAVIDILIRIGGILAVVYLIYAGVSFVISQGNPEKTAAARKRIINAIVGLAIILIATVLVAFIGNTIGRNP